MRYTTKRTGVCLVRIETQADGILITLRTNPDIGQISTEQVITDTDAGTAALAVERFLTAFAADS
jgi:hypothetical protein